MKRPKKVKVAGFDIDLVDLKPHVGRGTFGEFSSLENVIRVDFSVNRIHMIDTLLHEIGHAIYWTYGIHDTDEEERVVGVFATGWTQVYRDNPDLLEFIKDNLK